MGSIVNVHAARIGRVCRVEAKRLNRAHVLALVQSMAVSLVVVHQSDPGRLGQIPFSDVGNRGVGVLPSEFGANSLKRLHQRLFVRLAIHRQQVGDAIFLGALQLQHWRLPQPLVEVFGHLNPSDGAALVFHPHRPLSSIAVQDAQRPGQLVGELLRARLGMGVQVPERGAKMTGQALQIQRPLLLRGQRVNHLGLGRAGHATEHHVGSGRL